MVDFGMTAQVIPQGPGVLDWGIFFNQGYMWDSLNLEFEPVNNFNRLDLAQLTQQVFYSNNTVLLGHGVAVYVDDDTPIGDFIDNDGDGLFDEELRNGRDDDLDGVIDEPDWGDEDDESQDGVFDKMDYDNFWPPITFTRRRGVDFTNEGQFDTTPVFTNVAQPNGSYLASFQLEAVRLREEALFVDDLIFDPYTRSPQFLFVRTGFSPVWYDPLPVLSDFALVTGIPICQVGFWITLGNDEEDYQAMIDTYTDPARADEFEYTYHHVFEIPDENGGEGLEFLEGNDVLDRKSVV